MYHTTPVASASGMGTITVSPSPHCEADLRYISNLYAHEEPEDVEGMDISIAHRPWFSSEDFHRRAWRV